MGYFQNIISSVKNTYANIKAYLTQPVYNRSGQVVGNRVTMVVRDIQTQIMHQFEWVMTRKRANATI